MCQATRFQQARRQRKDHCVASICGKRSTHRGACENRMWSRGFLSWRGAEALLWWAGSFLFRPPHRSGKPPPMSAVLKPLPATDLARNPTPQRKDWFDAPSPRPTVQAERRYRQESLYFAARIVDPEKVQAQQQEPKGQPGFSAEHAHKPAELEPRGVKPDRVDPSHLARVRGASDARSGLRRSHSVVRRGEIKCRRQLIDQKIDLGPFCHKRWRHNHGIAGLAHHQPTTDGTVPTKNSCR